MKKILLLIVTIALAYFGITFFRGQNDVLVENKRLINQGTNKTNVNTETDQQLNNGATPTPSGVGAPNEASGSNTNVNTPLPTTSTSTSPTANVNTEPPTNANSNSSQTPPVIQSSVITVSEPASGSSVQSPLVISGKAKSQIGTPLTILITDKSGKTLITETAKVKNVGSDGWGTYKITISYEFSNTRDGNLVVFDSIDPEERVSVPLTFN